MILTCESCHARYLVPNRAIGANGRQVRCKKCGFEWFQEPEETEIPLPAEEELTPPPERVEPIRKGSAVPALPGAEATDRSDMRGRMAGYAAAAVIFVLSFGVLLAARGAVVRALPAAAGLYGSIGMAPARTGEGLAFNQVTAQAVPNGQAVALTVKGTLVNMTGHAVKVPQLEVFLREPAGKTVDHWRVDPPRPELAPHAEVAFEATYPALPETVKGVQLNLVTEQ